METEWYQLTDWVGSLEEIDFVIVQLRTSKRPWYVERRDGLFSVFTDFKPYPNVEF